MFARAGQPLQKGLMYFIDYSYLYQYKREERHQSNSFQKAMGNMHVLYSSDFTMVERVEAIEPYDVNGDALVVYTELDGKEDMVMRSRVN